MKWAGLARRVGIALLTLVLASIAIFAVLHAVPGDPAVALAGADASPATLAACARSWASIVRWWRNTSSGSAAWLPATWGRRT